MLIIIIIIIATVIIVSVSRIIIKSVNKKRVSIKRVLQKNEPVHDYLKRFTLHISSEVLDNAFRCDLVSEGYFGAVYRVLHDGNLCAAKYRRFDNGLYKVEQFCQECLLHCKLNHQNIVQMLGVCYHSNNPWEPIKIMEFLELDLSSVIKKFKIPIYVKLELLKEAGEGLDYLHTRNPPIVHSSLTMKVIFVTANLTAKIGGFTFTVEIVPETKRFLEATAGNEILKSSLYCGPPFDIYSFGWLTCKAITERRFRAGHNCLVDSCTGNIFTIHVVDTEECRYNLNQIKESSLKQLVISCTNNDPNRRPSASQMNDMMKAIIKGKFIVT